MKLKALTAAFSAAVITVSAGAFSAFADSGDVEINNTNFPDENFRTYVEEKCDKDGNGSLSQGEKEKITSIWAPNGISNMKGIEYFTALTYLNCGNNQLTSLDVSKNTALTYLNCDGNQLTSLDVSKNTALTELYCASNYLTNLDVSRNTALTNFWCGGNQLKSLDVSKNTALTKLSCGNNQLTSLDVSQNTALIDLICYENQFTSFDVSNNTVLTDLHCSNNQLTSLDVSQNTALIDLICYENQFTSLDVSNNTALEKLYCHKNQLTSLDLSKNTALEKLYCYENQLTSLDLSKNTALTELYCSNNQLTELDVGKNTVLTRLYCQTNQLTSLDVRGFTKLMELICYGNQLTSLDVSQNTALKVLSCDDNKLVNLDISKNTALNMLSCSENRLTSLDLRTNTALTNVYSYDNTYSIGNVTSYDLRNLPTGFDITKASKWRGATLDGSVLTNITSDKITYTYDCGNGKSETFTLVVSEKADDPDDTSDPVSSFVNRLYNIILDRPAESAGLDDWTNALASGERTSADIVYGLANSPEFNNKALSNDQIVERMYLAMLGRGSDASGKADWLSAMANGCTVNGIINGFSGSAEFANVCSGYGIEAGSITSCEARDINVNLTEFVSRMYTKALGRDYDVYGLNDWTGDYIIGAATADKIAYGFILSDEFVNRNLSDEAYVDTLYRTFFNREPDAGGKAGWVNELRRGASRKDVLDGFLGAEEFANLKASFGV